MLTTLLIVLFCREYGAWQPASHRRLRGRGLVDGTGGFTAAGRETKERIETLTDELAAPAYDVLTADELEELIAGLVPIAAAR